MKKKPRSSKRKSVKEQPPEDDFIKHLESIRREYEDWFNSKEGQEVHADFESLISLEPEEMKKKLRGYYDAYSVDVPDDIIQWYVDLFCSIQSIHDLGRRCDGPSVGFLIKLICKDYEKRFKSDEGLNRFVRLNRLMLYGVLIETIDGLLNNSLLKELKGKEYTELMFSVLSLGELQGLSEGSYLAYEESLARLHARAKSSKAQDSRWTIHNLMVQEIKREARRRWEEDNSPLHDEMTKILKESLPDLIEKVIQRAIQPVVEDKEEAGRRWEEDDSPLHDKMTKKFNQSLSKFTEKVIQRAIRPDAKEFGRLRGTKGVKKNKKKNKNTL